MSKKIVMNLQKFAEGTTAGEDTGVNTDDAGQNTEELENTDLFETGEEGEEEPEKEPEEESFESLIEGKYKSDFGAKVAGIVQDRVKNMQSQIDEVSPVLTLLSKKYGVDSKNIQDLVTAIENDDALYEDEAQERGIDVSTLKYIKKLERQNNDFAQQMEERERNTQADEAWNEVLNQSKELKNIYPDFDIEKEMFNEDFGRLVATGIPVRTAFEVVHLDEIQPQVMRYVADETARKVANSVKSNKNRPQEGSKMSQPVKVKKDVSQLTDAERDVINARIMAGEEVIL